jgi:hypothetical protein
MDITGAVVESRVGIYHDYVLDELSTIISPETCNVLDDTSLRISVATSELT